jgi:hypothetical protein
VDTGSPQEMRQLKKTGACSGEVDTGSPQEMRQLKNIRANSDST